MAPTCVWSFEDLIYWEYAKLISLSTYGDIKYFYVHNRYKLLRENKMSMSDTIREWKKEMEIKGTYCAYCGEKENLSVEHIIPKAKGGSDNSDNLVYACKSCNSSKGDKLIFHWLSYTNRIPYSEKLDRILAGKYLKELYIIHQQRETLGVKRDQMEEYCDKCILIDECKKWKKKYTITPLCLETIFYS